MNDPLNTRWDLMPGNSIPYTDDPDGYDPTDALTVYSLPKLDPTVNNSNAPQDQSAALLDPSAFQPAANIGILGPVTPPGATTLTTPDGTPFYAPAGADFDQIYAAGEKIRDDNFIKKLLELGPIVQKGRFDFQRQGSPFNGNYTNASNFAVGDFMNGAGFSWPATVVLGDAYALAHDGLRIPPNDKPWWQSGYDAAASGQLPKKGVP